MVLKIHNTTFENKRSVITKGKETIDPGSLRRLSLVVSLRKDFRYPAVTSISSSHKWPKSVSHVKSMRSGQVYREVVIGGVPQPNESGVVQMISL